MGKLCPPLLGRHSSDGTATAGRLPVATESYGPLVQMPIVVVSLLENRVGKSSGDRCELIKFVGFVCAAQTPTCMKIKRLVVIVGATHLWLYRIYSEKSIHVYIESLVLPFCSTSIYSPQKNLLSKNSIIFVTSGQSHETLDYFTVKFTREWSEYVDPQKVDILVIV
jgi:hypothetical protein